MLIVTNSNGTKESTIIKALLPFYFLSITYLSSIVLQTQVHIYTYVYVYIYPFFIVSLTNTGSMCVQTHHSKINQLLLKACAFVIFIDYCKITPPKWLNLNALTNNLWVVFFSYTLTTLLVKSNFFICQCDRKQEHFTFILTSAFF